MREQQIILEAAHVRSEHHDETQAPAVYNGPSPPIMIMSDAEVSMDLGSESYEQSRAVLDQGYQGVSGSIRNQDQGWGYQGSLISGSRVKSGSGQRPAPGSTWLTRILVRLFLF
jgi:hypothetical protein